MKPFLLFLSFSLLFDLRAQSPATPTSDRQLILQLLDRVQSLEAEVARLRGQATPSTPSPTPTPLAPLPSPDPLPVQAPIDPPVASSTAPMMPGMSHDMTPLGLGTMRIQGFSDVQYHASNFPGQHQSFGLGQFNLFITNQLSNKLSVVAEAVMEADQSNGFGIDLERLLVQYAASDYLNLSVGRFHSSIGYFNTAYHHASWLQTTVERPFLFAFEDKGGILPIHNVGLSASGRIPSGPLDLSYIAEVGNGRSSRSPLDEPVQNLLDENNGKSYNLGLIARPSRLPGFQAGFSVYRDQLHPEGLSSIGQTIYSGHAVYHSSRLELMNELIVMKHSLPNNHSSTIPGFYSQASIPRGKFRPYFRYEYLNVPQSSPLYSDVGLRHGPTAGLRFDLSEFAAYKVEYFRDMRRAIAGNGLRTQISFTF